MKYFPRIYSIVESNAFIDKTIQIIEKEGFGLLAVETKDSKEFIGFVGLSRPSFESYFTPCTEIGWRLQRSFWGKGLASEAAKEVARHSFYNLKLKEIVSFTSSINIPSIKVMERIGMKRHNNESFNHPRIDVESPLRSHVLYRMRFEDLT